MTTQSPETKRGNACPHCEDFPLWTSDDVGRAKTYVCDHCGCVFSAATMEVVEAGETCPAAALMDDDRL
jgi:hypothetical protein